MTTIIKARLVVFVLLSALGIVYVSASYLGIVDTVLGRGYTVTAQLPGTGGLYPGGEVTYRGVKIGLVGEMEPNGTGVDVTLELDEGTKIPLDAPMFVHNGSAVGEQYLDFEPVDDSGPYAREGAVLKAGPDTLPVDESDLLVKMDRFVSSVDANDLSTLIGELGNAFFNTGEPLQDLIDGSNTLIDAASANQDQTIALLKNGEIVLKTQAANATAIRQFASGLNTFTRALADSDQNVRTLLQGGPATLAQVQALLKGLKPTMPVLLGNLVTVNQVVALRLPALEELLVTFPALIAGGFAGTEGGFGHVNLQFAQEPGPCTKGYLPASKWRDASDESDGTPFLAAKCDAPFPETVRGTKYAPRPGGGARVAPYDPATGTVQDAGETVVLDRSGLVNIYGEDAWKWMLVGPTVQK